MSQDSLVVSLRYYGISPWEIEVLYGLLHDMFIVKQEQVTVQDENYDSMINLYFPLQFNDEFFKWFGQVRWDKVKALLKEMKRRRGGGKTIKVYIFFSGNPSIKFLIDLDEYRWFNIAIEKIDFMLELLEYQLSPQNIPQNITEVIYEFDKMVGRWRLDTIFSHTKKYVFSEKEWKLVT